MPSRATPARSAVFDTTTLWPIAAAGSLPVCVSSRVMVAQLAETVASFRSNFMASSPFRLTVQLPAAWAMPAAPNRARASREWESFIVWLRRSSFGWVWDHDITVRRAAP